MTEKPKTISSILSEAMLLQDFLGIPRPKSGKSRVISSWVRQGLRCMEVSGQRFFFEEDLVEFFWNRYKQMSKSNPAPFKVSSRGS